MRIGILGAGVMGGGLGTIFARRHEVIFSDSRSRQTLDQLGCDSRVP
jgi:predicted dinucleotide-binding enzyme